MSDNYSEEDMCIINKIKIDRLSHLLCDNNFTREQIVDVWKKSSIINKICKNPVKCTMCHRICTLEELDDMYIGRLGELICKNCKEEYKIINLTWSGA